LSPEEKKKKWVCDKKKKEESFLPLIRGGEKEEKILGTSYTWKGKKRKRMVRARGRGRRNRRGRGGKKAVKKKGESFEHTKRGKKTDARAAKGKKRSGGKGIAFGKRRKKGDT